MKMVSNKILKKCGILLSKLSNMSCKRPIICLSELVRSFIVLALNECLPYDHPKWIYSSTDAPAKLKKDINALLGLQPDLDGVNLEFIKLFLACTLKINIRKQAIENFFEWDKLNRASAEKYINLGSFYSAFIVVSHSHYFLTRNNPSANYKKGYPKLNRPSYELH